MIKVLIFCYGSHFIVLFNIWRVSGEFNSHVGTVYGTYYQIGQHQKTRLSEFLVFKIVFNYTTNPSI